MRVPGPRLECVLVLDVSQLASVRRHAPQARRGRGAHGDDFS